MFSYSYMLTRLLQDHLLPKELKFLADDIKCASCHRCNAGGIKWKQRWTSTSSQVAKSFLQPLRYPCEGWPADTTIHSLLSSETRQAKLVYRTSTHITHLRFASCLQQAAAIWEYQGGVFAGNKGLRPSETTPNMTCILLIPVYAGSPIKASHTACIEGSIGKAHMLNPSHQYGHTVFCVAEATITLISCKFKNQECS